MVGLVTEVVMVVQNVLVLKMVQLVVLVAVRVVGANLLARDLHHWKE